jgi:DNA-binding MarR family transcriptional regulator
MDSVGRLLRDWAQVQPDLPVASVGVFSRMYRIRALYDRLAAEVFAAHDLTGPDFEVLANLTRLRAATSPIRQYELQRAVALTPGTVSLRLDRLAGRDLVRRLADPDDGRNTLVALTPRGAALFARLAPQHLDRQRQLLDAALTGPRQRELAGLLALLLESLEDRAGPS